MEESTKMSTRLYKTIAILALLCIQYTGLSIAAGSANDQLTEQNIQALMNGIDDAVARGDVASIASCLADNFVVKVNYGGPSGMKATQLTRDEYLAKLDKSLRQISNYVIIHSRSIVSIAPDAQS